MATNHFNLTTASWDLFNLKAILLHSLHYTLHILSISLAAPPKGINQLFSLSVCPSVYIKKKYADLFEHTDIVIQFSLMIKKKKNWWHPVDDP